MIKVKEGDVLVCINAEKQSIVKRGELYTARKLDGHRVYIEEHKRFSYLISRFRHATEGDLK